MKRIAILSLLFFFFLMIGTVRGANITFDTPIDITGGYAPKEVGLNNVTQIKGFYDPTLEDFIVAVSSGRTVDYIRFVRWESTEFSTKLDGWTTEGIFQTPYAWDIIPYNTTHFMFALERQTYRNITLVNTSSLPTAYTDLIGYSDDTTNYPNDCGNIINQSMSIDEWGVYTRTMNCLNRVLNDTRKYPSSSLSMPSAYDKPLGAKLFYGDGYHHLIVEHHSGTGGINTESSIYGLIYDRDWEYYRANALTDSDDSGLMTNPQMTKKGDAYHLSYIVGNQHRNETQNMTSIRFRTFNFNTDNQKYYEVFSELYTPPNVVEGINYTSAHYLYYDPTHEHFWLFYAVWNGTGGNNGFKGLFVQKESGYCDCSAWYNTSCLSGTSYMTQIRVCPADCDDEEQYVWDSWCNQTKYYPEHTYPRTSTVSGTGTCDTGWYDPVIYGQIRCDASIIIPDNCTNINTSATFHNSVESGSTWWANLGDTKYSVTICNPLINCNQYIDSWLCEDQSNLTLTVVNSSYNAGDTATGLMVVVGSPCQHRKNVLWEYGWKRYRVTGSITYFCNQYCGGWKCRTLGLVEQRIWQYPDCTFNESSAETCSYGCLDGLCLTEIGEEQIIRTPSGNPFEWIIGEAEYGLGSTVTTIFAFAASLGVGAYGMIITKKWQMGAMAIIGMVALFMGIGWLPAIIGILWILSIALILAKGIFFKD